MSEIDQDLINAAKQHFGITHNPKETGYILPDGTRLDLSGKHYSNDYIRDKKTNKNVLKKPGNDYLRNNRIVDHRELFDHPNLTSTDGTDKMLEFMRKTGAMRVMPGIGVSTVRMPTDAQINKSVADHRKISPDDELWVDTKDDKEFGNAFDGKFKNPTVEKVKSHFVKEYPNKNINEDLRKWFREKWVRFDTKGNIKGDCAREPGEGKPKCLPQAKAHALGKKKRASAARRKRREDPHAGREGKAKFVKTHNEETIREIRNVVKAAIIHSRQLKRNAKTLAKNPNLTTAQKIRYAVTHGGMKGQEAAEKIWDYPYNVTTPTSGALYTAAGALGSPALNIAKITARLKKRRKKMNEETLLEKNVPTNPKLWAQAKAQAKKKFKIYPSAYANGWASKWYKSKGGGWKSLNEDYEHEMARNELRTAMRGIERLMKHLEGEGELEAWVQSKLTKASDYIDTLADYMDSRDKTVKEAYELISEAKKKMDKRTIPQTVQMQTPGSNPYADDSTCPSYVSTPGQPITEVISLKGVYKELAGKKGPKAAEQRELLKALARGRQKKAKEKKEKAAEAAKTPLYAGPKKGSAPPKSKPPAKNLSPKMKPEGTPAERIGAAFNRPGYKPMPQSDFSYQERLDNLDKKLTSHLSKEWENEKHYDRESGEKLITAYYPLAIAHYERTGDKAYLKKLKEHRSAHEYYSKHYPQKRIGMGRRLLKALNLVKEEHGAGDVGTTELVQNYIASTPGQILDPAEHKKPKITDTIKKVVKEEVLNEYTKLATSAGHRTGVTVTKPRSGSPAGRVRRTVKKRIYKTTVGRHASRAVKPKSLRPREKPVYARGAVISSLRGAQSGARTREQKVRASVRIAAQQRRARLR